jgi:hypothetical protein
MTKVTVAAPGGHLSEAADNLLLDPEWEILLAGCTGNPEAGRGHMSSLLETAESRRPVNWQAVLGFADANGTSSLLYRSLLPVANLVPPAVVESLRRTHESNAHKSLFLARELIRVLDFANAIAVEALPYKGIVLAEAFYDDIALRGAGDLDVFVRKRDFTRMKNALPDLGYIARNPVPEIYEQDYLASGYECSFDGAAGKNLLELQWALQPHFYAVDFDMDSLFARAVPATVGGREVRTPSPEDLLLLLSIHAAKHIWSRLIWICDIARILRRQDLDWDWIQSRSREIGVLRILYINLLLANRLLEAPLPATLKSAILADGIASSIAGEVEESMLAGVAYDTQHVSYFRMMLRLRERPIDRIRFLWRLASTPGPGEWQAVRLPQPLFPLYRVIRIGRLAARFARGSGDVRPE